MNLKFYIKGTIKIIISCFLIFLVSLVVLYALFVGLMFYTVYTPPHDLVYIRYMEYYAEDSLPSCKVVCKKYHEAEYTTAIYRLNHSDFLKVLEKVQSHKYLDDSSCNYFNERAIELMCKEKIHPASDINYYYTLFRGDHQIGFKSPDLIIYYSKLHD
ncbi:MAG: hypothetical protein LBV72_17805 [Tannerella sp.]|nr:hypothetical protein [Tannerella sp.]